MIFDTNWSDHCLSFIWQVFQSFLGDEGGQTINEEDEV